MNEPTVLAAHAGCPHCRTRRECACPDGPEQCPDNPTCPCDPTVCPCKRPKRLPEPPGCLTRPMWIGLGAAGLVGLIVLVSVLLFGGDDSPDEVGPRQQISATSTTVAANNSTNSSSTTAPAQNLAPVPPLGPDVADEADAVFGGKDLFLPEYCTPVLPGMRQTDQTGGGSLTDPSLNIDAWCIRRAMLDGSQVPMFVGDFLLVAAVHAAPLDPATNIRYQPGIGLDLPGLTNIVPKSEGEGLLQSPIDTVGFGGNLDGWAEAQFYSLPDFTSSGLHGYAFSEPGSPVTAFAIPSELVPFDTVVVLQSFGRLTAPGAAPTNADPSSSTLVHAGAAPCLGDCMVGAGRFQVSVEWPSDAGATVSGAEGANGSFWFVSPENIDLLVKVLNGCGAGSDHYWVFAGSLTDVQATISVTDTSTGAVSTYTDPLGTGFAPILDTSAFATCP